MNTAERSKAIREMTGLSRAEFSRQYKIPLRTLEDWDSGRGKPPEYVLDLLEEVVEKRRDCNAKG